jgi:hypothetical protein
LASPSASAASRMAAVPCNAPKPKSVTS